jgi:hypothetical protein
VSGRLFRDAPFADERSPDPRLGVSVLVESNQVVWIRPSDAEEEIGPAVEIVHLCRSGVGVLDVTRLLPPPQPVVEHCLAIVGQPSLADAVPVDHRPVDRERSRVPPAA